MYERIGYVLTALKLSSCQKASNVHFVAPQTISKAVGEEERRLGRRLFYRRGRGVEPTEFGLFYLKSAEVLLEALQTFEASLALYEERDDELGSLGLCIGQLPLRGDFGRWFNPEEFCSRFPFFNLEISFVAPEAGALMLKCGKVDAAILPGIPNALGSSVLTVVDVPLRVLASRLLFGDRNEVCLNEIREVRVAAFGESGQFGFDMRSALVAIGLNERTFVSIPLSIQSAIDFVLQGGIIFTGPNNELTTIDNRLVELRIEEEPFAAPVSLSIADCAPVGFRRTLRSYLFGAANASA